MIKQLFLLCFVYLALLPAAHTETYIREYTYSASENDSKITSRIHSINRVKSSLLQEIGTQMRQVISIEKNNRGGTFASEDIETISMGLVKAEILQEFWNGITYHLKAQLEVDPEQILTALKQIKKPTAVKQQQLLESLKDNIRKLDLVHIDAESLSNKLVRITNATKRNNTVSHYIDQVDQVAFSDIFNKLYHYDQKTDLFQHAFYWFEIVAKQGVVSAQFNLGVLYDKANHDYTKAAYWYHQAIKQGMAEAQNNLGAMYGRGDGFKPDNAIAVKWYRKAAKQGLAIAQYNLGLMYRQGKGIKRNDEQAILWYHKAANQGLANAQYNLGFMHSHVGSLSNIGINIKQDHTQAVYWYRRAAEQGHAYAQLHLGIMYLEGINVKRNETIASMWLNKSCDNSNEAACLFLKLP
jgi:TPR repeat protein